MVIPSSGAILLCQKGTPVISHLEIISLHAKLLRKSHSMGSSLSLREDRHSLQYSAQSWRRQLHSWNIEITIKSLKKCIEKNTIRIYTHQCRRWECSLESYIYRFGGSTMPQKYRLIWGAMFPDIETQCILSHSFYSVGPPKLLYRQGLDFNLFQEKA